MNDDGTESHRIKKDGGHARATLKVTPSDNDQKCKTHVASDLKHLDTELHRRRKKGQIIDWICQDEG